MSPANRATHRRERERVGLRVWRATNGLWTGEVRVRVRVSDGVWAGARGGAIGGHLVRSPWCVSQGAEVCFRCVY